MAYIKQLQLNNGFSAEYWRITEVPANKLSVRGDVIVLGYKDKATRDNGGKPITRKSFVIDISDLDFSQDIFEQAYTLIKDMKERKDALNPNAETFFSDAQNA